MNVGIVANSDRDLGLVFAKEIAMWLRERGCCPFLEPEDSVEEVYKGQFLIVLGGDGTMLRAASKAAIYSTPMLGINLGSLGYLTDVERHEGLSAIEKVLAGNFRQEQRMMLEARDMLALNEVIVHRDRAAGSLSFRICVNGKHMDTFRADGVIISTPTGSTAYNLSAGGPILRPDSEMIVITAICPHTLYARPWVLSGNDEVSICPVGSQDRCALASLDGEIKFSLKCGETINIGRSKYRATVIKTTGMDFFEVLRKKMAK